MKNFWKIILPALILILGFGVFIFVREATPAAGTASEKDLIAGFENVPCANDERLTAVKNLFLKAGASSAELSVKTFETGENLVVVKKGRTSETIVVGAHFDKTEKGCGAIDNWTGVVIIANLYGSLRGSETEKTYMFVAFGEEEKGLAGSRSFVDEIPAAEKKNYCAMVNFDSFGFASPQALGNASDPKLVEIGAAVARDSGFELSSPELPKTGADSVPFNQKGIPAITFHGLSDDWQRYLHTDRDETNIIKSRSVYLGYRFALSFLAKLDSVTCPAL